MCRRRGRLCRLGGQCRTRPSSPCCMACRRHGQQPPPRTGRPGVSSTSVSVSSTTATTGGVPLRCYHGTTAVLHGPFGTTTTTGTTTGAATTASTTSVPKQNRMRINARPGTTFDAIMMILRFVRRRARCRRTVPFRTKRLWVWKEKNDLLDCL